MILETAARLIEEVGYANLNIEMIIDEVGIARATLYQHYRNKEDIVVNLVLREMKILDEHIRNSSGRAIERLEATLRYMLRDEEKGFTGTVVNDEILTNLFATHPEISQLYIKTYSLIDGIISEAKADGDIEPLLHNQIIITLLFNLMHMTQGKTSVDSSIPAEHTVEQTIRIFLRGLKP